MSKQDIKCFFGFHDWMVCCCFIYGTIKARVCRNCFKEQKIIKKWVNK